ncbi:MAG: hypothetical protein DLM58_05815 [Pseudonocardiales bacterium]|nr:MAG: hypothetical protein DLM58_05815 [Pseudonocardiales bacterium]
MGFILSIGNRPAGAFDPEILAHIARCEPHRLPAFVRHRGTFGASHGLTGSKERVHSQQLSKRASQISTDDGVFDDPDLLKDG